MICSSNHRVQGAREGQAGGAVRTLGCGRKGRQDMWDVRKEPLPSTDRVPVGAQPWNAKMNKTQALLTSTPQPRARCLAQKQTGRDQRCLMGISKYKGI